MHTIKVHVGTKKHKIAWQVLTYCGYDPIDYGLIMSDLGLDEIWDHFTKRMSNEAGLYWHDASQKFMTVPE